MSRNNEGKNLKGGDRRKVVIFFSMESSFGFQRSATALSAQVEAFVVRALGDFMSRQIDAEQPRGTTTSATAPLLLWNDNSSTCDTKKKRSLVSVCQVLLVASYCHCMLLQGQRCTEREMYYALKGKFANIDLVTSQSFVGCAIRRLCEDITSSSICGTVTPPCLGVDATAKSTIVGHLTLRLPLAKRNGVSPTSAGEGEVIDVSQLGSCGLAVSSHIAQHASCFEIASTVGSEKLLETFFILVVEKEGTFRHLLQAESFLSKFRCAVLCVRGFPCQASRLLLRRIQQDFMKRKGLHVPVLSLTDGDIYGRHITWCTHKTQEDESGWMKQLLSRSCAMGTCRGAASTRQQNSFDDVCESLWKAHRPDILLFAECVASSHRLGLTSNQIIQLQLPSTVTWPLSAKEVKRAAHLRQEIARVRMLLEFALSSQFDHGTQATSAAILQRAVGYVSNLMTELDETLERNVKAELQSLLVAPSGHNGAAQHETRCAPFTALVTDWFVLDYRSS